MQQSIINNTSDEVSALYALFSTTLNGMYVSAVNMVDPTSERARLALRLNANALAVRFRGLIKEKIDQAMLNVSTLVVSLPYSVSEDDQARMSTNLELVSEDISSLISNSMRRDIDTAIGSLREFALRVDMLQASRNIGRIGAIIHVRFGLNSSVKFTQTDRLGRRYVSEGYIRTAVRGVLVRTVVESHLFVLVKSGYDLAEVVNLGSKDHGLVFSITGTTPGYESYENIVHNVFHPNSNATVEVAVP